MILRHLSRLNLLPVTMAGLAMLLVVKSAGLIGAAYGAAEGQALRSSPSPPPTENQVGTPAATASTSGAASAPAPRAESAGVAPTPTEPMPSVAERALLMDLRKRRVELDARAATLDSREALLGAAEKRLAVRLDELTSLQKRLEALEAARRDRDEASWRGLVRVYETMKPKDAAVIFNDLDSPVLLQVVDRMKDGKAAAILAAMAPDRARRLTADLSTLRSRANAPPDPSAAKPLTANAPAGASP